MNTTKTQRYFARALILFLISLFAFSLRAEAFDELWDQYEVPSTRQKERLLDDADLLTDGEESLLLDKLNDVSNKWNCNVVVLTVDNHSGPIQDYADDYFDYNGFGADFNDNGILFMLSMYDREWAISTSGRAQYAFTDYGQEYLFDQMRGDLADGDYYDAFVTYVNVCDRLLEMDSQGTPYDIGTKEPVTASGILVRILGSIFGGSLVALIPLLKMKSDLKTVRMAANASQYQESQGIRLTRQEDRFVRKTLHKTPIPKDNDSRGSSGGGSTLHTSSSGHSHGGSHGHF